jgi:WD and tetratricopeptide repeats protein 1
LNLRKKYKLPELVENLKIKANKLFEDGNYYESIVFYNKAISEISNSSILFGNRAAALMKRGWDGDMYAAIRDCYSALNLDKDHMKSHFRLSKCLHELKWDEEAKECLNKFIYLYKDQSDSNGCDSLVNEIDKALFKKKKNNKSLKDDVKRTKLRNSDDDEEEEEEEDENIDDRAILICIEYEKYLKSIVIDYKSYYSGHCNIATDIKEALFIGE